MSRLTPARRRALEAMAAVHPDPARESNVTGVHRGETADGREVIVAFVYWQSARWLVEQELAYYPSGSTHLAFTAKGQVMAKLGVAG